MRFHKFDRLNGPIWVRLDAVDSLIAAPGGTEIHIGGWTHLVSMPLEDVLALISPPAAPDTYEEELRDRLGKIRAKVVEPEPFKVLDPVQQVDAMLLAARLDEIDRLRKAKGAAVAAINAGQVGAVRWLDRHINQRLKELTA